MAAIPNIWVKFHKAKEKEPYKWALLENISCINATLAALDVGRGSSEGLSAQ